MSAADIVAKLEATNSRTDKQTILETAWNSGEREFFIGVTLAYDPLLTFGIQKVALIEEDDGEPGTFTFQDFLHLSKQLSTRALTGHAARDAINAAAERCEFQMWNGFYRRVLLKDLKCGMTANTVNKVLKKVGKKDTTAADYAVSVIGCMLAQDSRENQNKMKGWKFLDQKLDGTRLFTVLSKEEGTVRQYTRKGKENTNFSLITTALEPLLAIIPGSMVLDGEVVSRNFQELMTQVNRKSGADTSDAKLALFDLIPLEDFKRGYCAKTQRERHEALTALTGLLQEHTQGSVFVIPKLLINLDTPEGQKSFREFNDETLKARYEGIMIKDPEAPYEVKRSSAWLKLKPFITVDLTITGMEEGKPDGKFLGTLGALLCDGIDQGKRISTKVGGGFSVRQRAELWAGYTGKPVSYDEVDRKTKQTITITVQPGNNTVGEICEVEADCLTLETDKKVKAEVDARLKTHEEYLEAEADKDEETMFLLREEISSEVWDIIYPGVERTYSLRFPVFARFRSIDEEKGVKD